MKVSHLLLMLICALSISCSSPDEIEYGGEQDESLVSIAYLKSLYERAPVLIDRDIYIEGTVVSTDQYGAFYKTIILNDKTGGIAIRIDMENYHRKYPQDYIYKIACNSLTLSDYAGQLQLGMGNNVIPNMMLPTVFIKETIPEKEFLPLPLTIDAIAPVHLQRLVRFDDIQFEEDGTWYAPEGRYIVDRKGNRLNVRASRYSHFADYILPVKSGFIIGILTVFNGTYQLEMSSSIFAIMENERF